MMQITVASEHRVREKGSGRKNWIQKKSEIMFSKKSLPVPISVRPFPSCPVCLVSSPKKVNETENLAKQSFQIHFNGKKTTPVVKKIHPFASVWYEIGVLWTNITHVKSHTTALDFLLLTDMNQIFQLRYCETLQTKGLQSYKPS